MSDLIRREEAIEWVKNILATHLYYHPRSKSRNVPIDEVIDRLERVPSIDAVPAVRCKDCKHLHLEKGTWTCVFALPSGPDGYCSYGER